jgi:hypothetical protein
MMSRRAIRATLIQNTTEFQAYLKPYLDSVMEPYASSGVAYEDALEWIVAEELELIYMLFDRKHQMRRRSNPYQWIYASLQTILPVPLSVCVSYYIAAPRLYEDLEVVIGFQGPDLHIQYFREAYAVAPVIYNYGRGANR